MNENQCGFRYGRSIAIAAQIEVRMNEDVCNYKKRGDIRGVNVAEEDEKPVCEIDRFGEQYPRVSKPESWMLLERYNLRGSCWKR